MYKEQGRSWMKHLDFILLDMVMLQLTLNMVYMIRHGMINMYRNENYGKLSAVLVLVSICVNFFLENYSGILRRGYLMELKASIQSVSGITGTLIVYNFFMKDSELYSRSVLLFFWIFGTVMVYVGRVLLTDLLLKRRLPQESCQQVLLLVKEEHAPEAIGKMRKYAYAGMEPIGIALIGADSGSGKIRGIPVIGTERDVIEYIKKHVVDEIYIYDTKEALIQNQVEAYIEAGVTVHLRLEMMDQVVGYKCVESYAGSTVLTTTFKSATPRQLVMKRMLDICGGLVGVVLTGIIFLFVAPIIYIQSPGSIFFSQWRVGRNGRRFKIHKFRSMYMDAEERKKELMQYNQMNGLMFKMENDPRIFPFGHFLRDTSLDEFPQFWNVLKGDMALVGTRPPTVEEYEQYELHHRRRISIKPGITGLWQVSGRSDITDFEEVVRLDTEYIADWRLASDIKILFQTVGVVLSRKGSR